MIEEAKVLTVRAPWAHFMFTLGNCKNVENRTRQTPYRGELLIHVSATMSRSRWRKEQAAAAATAVEAGARLEVLGFPSVWAERKQLEPTFGHIIGVVDLFDCRRDAKGAWAVPGAWHWVLLRPRALAHPIKFTGALYLQDAPGEILENVNHQLEGASNG